jgi:uncharacterized protein (TIGR03437 family)
VNPRFTVCGATHHYERETTMIGRSLPPTPVRILALAVLLSAALLAPCRVAAQTMLTNGSPLFVKLPIIPLTDSRRDKLVSFGKSYGIYVPPGARSLTIRFDTAPAAEIEMLIDIGVPPGTRGIGNRVATFRQDVNPLGFAEIKIDEFTHPDLVPGTYFIGFFVEKSLVEYTGSIIASVDGGVVDGLFPLVESRFDSDLDGWTRNDTASTIPGTNVGHPSASLTYNAEGGNPSGHARIRAGNSSVENWFVAPSKFNVDLLALSEPRFDFDLARFTGRSESTLSIEVRVFSDNGGFRYVGRVGPSISEGWIPVSVPIRKDFWTKFAGDDVYDTVFSQVKRIEVRANYTDSSGTTGLDNFRIVGRGTPPAKPVLPFITSFSAGIDRWTRNAADPDLLPGSSTGDADSVLVWVEIEGNPGGFIRLADNGGPALDAFVAPFDYRGDYSGLDNPRFEFDYRHRSVGGATRPVQVRIIGEDATIYVWTGAIPVDIWGHQEAPLKAESWVLESGEATFDAVVANIVRIEISADQADGPDWNQLDNFAVRTDDSPPLLPSLTANPPSLTFAGMATAPNPAEQTIQITSSGAALQWQAAAEGDLAERITLSETSGETPSEITIQVNTLDLEAGAYTSTVVFTAPGTTVEPSVVEIVLNLGTQPAPTPLISAGGIVNAGSNQAELAPGALGTIYGTNLGGPDTGKVTSYEGRTGDRLPTNVGGLHVRVLSFSGVLIGEAPLIYVSGKQINFQMPFEVAGQTSVQLVVDNNGARSAPQAVQIRSASPGLFTMAGNRALVINQDGVLNSSTHAGTRHQILTIYLTGQGHTAPDWPTGRAAAANPLIYAPAPARVLIGGVEANIVFLGLAPGLVGVTQLNVAPVWETPLGDQPLVVEIGGFTSNTAVVTIR